MTWHTPVDAASTRVSVANALNNTINPLVFNVDDGSVFGSTFPVFATAIDAAPTWPPTTTGVETMSITVAGNVVTATRPHAVAHAGNPVLLCGISAEQILEIQSAVDSISLTPGPTGATGATGAAGSTGATGAAGPTGPPLQFMGAWSTSTVYAIGMVVYYGGASYASSVAGNLNNQPDISPLYWTLVAAAGVAGGSYAATSTTSLPPAPITTTFTTQAGLAYNTSSRVRAQSAGTPTAWMEGQVTSYSGTTLVVAMDTYNGAGLFTDWVLSLSGRVGPAGPTGADGATGPTGPVGAGGKLINTATYFTGAVATGTTAIPNDNTIPQNNEGDQFMSLAYTNVLATSKLRIRAFANVAHSVANAGLGIGIFVDSIANAQQFATAAASATTGTMEQIQVEDIYSPGDTSSHTYKVRIGSWSGGTLTFNGSAGSALFGGSLGSCIIIEEWA